MTREDLIQILQDFIALLSEYDSTHRAYFSYYLQMATQENIEMMAELLQEAMKRHGSDR